MAILKEIVGYSNAVLDGRVTACLKHKWAALRFLDDLKQLGKWQWDFDEKAAEKYLTWMRLFKHSRGELAGQRKEPCDYELFVYGNIYGWYNRDGLRRFRQSYEQLARKQAKSQDKAIQALYEMSVFGEPNAEVYIAATKKAQTRFVWDEAVWLINNCGMSDKFVCKYDNALREKVIKHKKSGSFFSRLSKDDKRTGDGANPHFAIIDEYHLHETAEYYEVLKTGMKTRKNPLLSIITTAGYDLNVPCYREMYRYVSELLNPDIPVSNERFFAIVCELDRNTSTETIKTEDGRDIEPGGIIDELGSETAIKKSNPVTGMSAAVKASIEEEMKEARDNPERMRGTLTKTFNVWYQSRSEGYMDMARWGACKVTPEEIQAAILKAERGVFVGWDLSTKLDLTSVGFVFPWVEDGILHCVVKSHSFIPEDKYLERRGGDNVPYDVWRKEGWLTVTDGAVVDYDRVLKYVLDTCKVEKWNIAEFDFDPYAMTSLSNNAQSEGITVVQITQNILTLSEPTKAFREGVYARRVMHDGNPVLSWAVGNAVVYQDINQNIRLDKKRAKQRIDPLAAIITAFARARIVPPKPKRRRPIFLINTSDGG